MWTQRIQPRDFLSPSFFEDFDGVVDLVLGIAGNINDNAAAAHPTLVAFHLDRWQAQAMEGIVTRHLAIG